MRITKYTILFSVILSLFSSGISFISCGRKTMNGMIIVTLSAADPERPDYLTGDSWRTREQTRLTAIDPDKPEKSPQLLTAAFFSARSPEISYDGKNMLFAAQKMKDGPWQIWEMNLNNLKTKQITSSTENSIDPAYLPGGRVVFSRLAVNDSLKAGSILFTCNLDGTELKRITFNPHTYFASSTLKDGRILTISRQIFPVQNDPSMMILRPDGTKSELFYDIHSGNEVLSRGWETINGKIIFVESDGKANYRGSIISINYNRPLHTRINLTASISGDFHSAFPLRHTGLLITYRPSGNENYALYEFDSDKMTLGDRLYSSSEYDVLEAVTVNEHERPGKLPSEVDPEVKTGLLLCQNINVTGMQSPGNIYSFPGNNRVEIMGIDSSLGVVEVEEDGSFYLKVAADMPFRIKTLDSAGRILNGPGSWIWLRPNERRGCVGCHEDNERVPANRFAMAVKKQPVTVPVNVTEIKEKVVDLE